MTAPSITFGHGFLDDAWATLADDYELVLGGGTATHGVTTGHDLYITITPAFVNDVYVKRAAGKELAVPIELYPKIMFRYRTYLGAAQAKIVVKYNDDTTETVLAATTSSTWKTGSATLDDDKAYVKDIYFYAATGTGTVYYDFCLVHAGTFSFPQYTTVQWDMDNRYSNTEIPSRLGRRKAWMGANEVLVVINGPVDSDRKKWKRFVGEVPLDYNAAQVLEDIHHNAYSEAWQWLTTDRGAFKAVLEHLTILQAGDQPFLYSFSATFSEYRLSRAQTETWKERVKLP